MINETNIIAPKTVGDIISILHKPMTQMVLDALYHEEDGIETNVLRESIRATRKQYFYSLNLLMHRGIVIRSPGRKYRLTKFGKVIMASLIPIQQSLEIFWQIKSIDILENDSQNPERDQLIEKLIPYENIRAIINGVQK